jgi:hypothetical protein
MTMDWFRSWHNAPTDPKWLLIARRANVPPGMVSAVFWSLLDYASQEKDRGSVAGFDHETYAGWAGWEESDVLAILDAMRSKGVITSDDRLVSWEKRQVKREDETGADRQAKHRDNKRNASNAVDTIPDDVTQSNAASRNVTLDKIREDSDEIRQDDKREVSAPTAPPSKPPRTVTPGSQSDMFGAIADTCQLDAKLKAGQIAKQSKALLEAGYTPAQVRAFPVWWQLHDWRGQRGNVPTLAQLAELIKQSTTQTNGSDPVKVPQRGAWNNADRQSEEYKRKMDALIGD